MKQNNWTELSGYSFHDIHNQNDRPDPLTPKSHFPWFHRICYWGSLSFGLVHSMLPMLHSDKSLRNIIPIPLAMLKISETFANDLQDHASDVDDKYDLPGAY